MLALPDGPVEFPYPTGERRHNRVGTAGLVLAVLALILSATTSGVAVAVPAICLSVWGLRRRRRPTAYAYGGLVVSTIALVVSIAVAAGG